MKITNNKEFKYYLLKVGLFLFLFVGKNKIKDLLLYLPCHGINQHEDYICNADRLIRHIKSSNFLYLYNDKRYKYKSLIELDICNLLDSIIMF